MGEKGDRQSFGTAVWVGAKKNGFETRGFWVFGGGEVARFAWHNHGEYTLPEVQGGVGYDIPLGEHLALRLHTTGATGFVAFRAEAGGGLVAKF